MFVSPRVFELLVDTVDELLLTLPEIPFVLEVLEGLERLFSEEDGEVVTSFVLVMDEEDELFILLALLPLWLVAGVPSAVLFVSDVLEVISPVSFFAHPAKMVKLAIIKANFFIVTPCLRRALPGVIQKGPARKTVVRNCEFTRSRSSGGWAQHLM